MGGSKVMSQKETMLRERYFLEGETTEKQMFERVAYLLDSTKSERYQAYLDMMCEHRFIPNSPTLMNAGLPDGQLSACFVLPIEDSMESIFETLKNMALIQKTGGGVGYDFSKLRPENSIVQSTKRVASGPISFMKCYDAATNTIKQGGRRRGANMGVLNVHHDDILKFIRCKSDNTEITNFNISVSVTDTFMELVKKEAWDVVFNTHTGDTVGKIWKAIVSQAWLNGEPGLLFLDKINAGLPIEQHMTATNPCGEQPLAPYEACNLGSINLSKFVTYTDDGEPLFDEVAFTSTICYAVRFLNDVIDNNCYPLPQIEKAVKKSRKIGLGIMGYADMLIKMKMKYGSPEALTFTKFIAEQFNTAAHRASRSINGHNHTVTTIAPTGSISIIAECSSGIEPIFATEYVTKRMDKEFTVYHPLYEQLIIKENKTEYLPYFIKAHEVTPRQHILTQAVWQEYIDNAISKTINLPKHATVKDVEEAYLLAYDTNCKGITVYRDQSREGVLVHKEASTETIKQAAKIIKGTRHKLITGCGTMYMMVFVNTDGKVEEVFINTANGGCTSFTQATSRMISLSLRAGVPLSRIIDQLESANSCPSYQFARGSKKENLAPGKSCPSAMAKVLGQYLKKEEPIAVEDKAGVRCPICDNVMAMTEGCATCYSCGYSQCS